MSASAKRDERLTKGRIAAQWFGVLGPPAAVFGAQQISYALVDAACRREAPVLMLLPMVLGLAVTGAAAAFAWRSWQESSHQRSRSESVEIGTARFFAMVGLALSALALGLIVAQGLPALFLHPCQR